MSLGTNSVWSADTVQRADTRIADTLPAAKALNHCELCLQRREPFYIRENKIIEDRCETYGALLRKEQIVRFIELKFQLFSSCKKE
jgi:hypothetical protein